MCTLTPSSTSGFATVNLSSNAGCPAAGADTTLPVVGSTSVSGIGSFSGVPLTSVPNGAGFDALADELGSSGSLIRYSVSLLPRTTTSANEKTLALNFVVIFGPLPAPG